MTELSAADLAPLVHAAQRGAALFGWVRTIAVREAVRVAMPPLITDIRTFTVTGGSGEHLEALARSPLGLRARFDIVIRPGWCLMQSRFLVGGLAATAENTGTRFAFFGGLRIPDARLIERALHPLLHRHPVERFADQFRP